MLAVAIPTAVKAAPSQSNVTVGVGGAAPSTAGPVTGGPITGQGDNSGGAPLNPCPPQACESFGITLVAPAGFIANNVITLSASVSYDQPPSGSGPGTLDTYLEDASGNVLSSDPNSDNPSHLALADAAPGSYTLLIAGSTGADNSYSATVTAAAAARTTPTLACSGCAPITFSTPTIMSPIESVGEPTIAESPAKDDTVYASGPWGSGTQRSLWYASADHGQTFRLVQQCPPESGEVPTSCPPPTSVNGTANPPGGGDTDQRLDHTGKDYFVDLWALACDRMATTADHGATADQNALGCQHETASGGASSAGGSDRQWLSVFDPKLTGATSTAADAAMAPVIYMEYNRVEGVGGNGCSFWLKSTDGLNFSAADGGISHYGCDGYPSVDQVTGDVFEAAGGKLNIGVPDAGGNLTFLDDAGGNAIGNKLIDFAGAAGAADTLFAVSSMDTGRNLHVTWTNSARQVFTTVASYKTNWTRFAAPVQVSLPPANTNVFPWVVAGGAGRSDSVWYGTNSTADPSSNAGQEWNVYMTQLTWPVDSSGAVTLAPPTGQMVRVSPHPAHYNSICLAGTGCIASQGDRNLADFFSVTVDHFGAAEVEYDDTTNGLEEAGFAPGNGLADHAGAPVVTIARQDGGAGLDGTPVTTRADEPTSAPTTGMTHAAGQALYPVIGGMDQPALDLTGNQLAMSADGKTLTVTMDVKDLSTGAVSSALTNVTGSQFLQYVTRWLMCPTNPNTETNNCSIYYAMAEIPAATGVNATVQYYAGAADSIDLCSVSACDPHAEYYPESASSSLPNATGNSETGSVSCPASGSCTLSISVPTADVGSPTQGSLLEEVGSYSFASARPQAAVTFAQAEADLLPLEIDGVCCFNFQAAPTANTPEAPWTPGLVVGGLALIAAAGFRRRHGRRRAAGMTSTLG